ncbi:hypothetical protein [Limnochorda pilosa]|uniref:Core-binding (CB) domain-containing protein n=1 Tax=Limnochorda pilosa TaxID=1555112 RepID=A0A0K2SK14_LIMPI|nr:hypothetical protein [Limnochorda pilosa]BAS27440.1 hypothetical protein LIP_1594 [Limnochorda pilosa]
MADASRFVRYLLARADAAAVEAFLEETTRSPVYRQRLRASLRRFLRFARREGPSGDGKQSQAFIEAPPTRRAAGPATPEPAGPEPAES